MSAFNSNILIALLIAVVLIAVIYFFNRSNKCPIPNHGTLPHESEAFDSSSRSRPQTTVASVLRRRTPTQQVDTVTGTPTDRSVGAPLDYAFSEASPYADALSIQSPYRTPTRPQKIARCISACFSDASENDAEEEFTFKKKKYIRRTPASALDQLDPEQLLPQQVEEDWFELPLLGTNTVKKVQNANLLHPKLNIGINTQAGTLRNPSLDPRGDVSNPKIQVSPWLNSTIEPDINRGLCG